MKIANCQINPLVGDIEGNYNKIIELHRFFSEKDVDLCIFPELALSGYLAQDLFLQPKFVQEIHNAVDEILCFKSDTALILPTAWSENGKLYNACLVIQNGKIIGKTFKSHLPNYGIFDEKRYFTPGEPHVIEVKGVKVGIPICEDIWHSDICSKLKSEGAEIFIIPNGSPYDKEKYQHRLKIVAQRFDETQIPMIYCNQVVGQDGIVFDGKSFAYDGSLKQFAPAFKTSEDLIFFKKDKFITTSNYKFDNNLEDIYSAILLGTREYFINNGFRKAILGLSGGIDSCLVATILADSIGPSNVTGIMLSSKFTSKQSKKDAIGIASNIGIKLEEYDISKAVKMLCGTIGMRFNWDITNLTIENIQSRTRGTILMAEANKNGALLITTGNKSEIATGYATLYGDMNGAFNPIKDIYKTEVYLLAKYRNSIGHVIPDSAINKAPTAELSPKQQDSDTLPEYSILDQILELMIEKNLDIETIIQHYPRDIVYKIHNLLKNSEFKRYQSAPGVKISTCIFNLDRRYPITNCATVF